MIDVFAQMLKCDVNDVLNLREIGAEFDCLAPEINELPDGKCAAYNGGELFYDGGNTVERLF